MVFKMRHKRGRAIFAASVAPNDDARGRQSQDSVRLSTH